MTGTDSPPGVIVTFYSYKGGTGRSMALANVGYLAGQRLAGEQKVILIDWDLEAPGLHRYFPESESPVNVDRPGLIDYFTRLVKLLDDEVYKNISEPEGWHALEALLPLDEYIVPEVADGVDLIKAGRFGPEYIDLISSFQWAEFYRRYRRVYRAFSDYLTEKYKWCFIDSRTGLSDVSGVCTMLMPEKLVTVFTPNRQSLDGVVELAANAIEYRRNSDDPRPLSIFPLPSRIVTEEHKLLQAATDKYRNRFEECLRLSYELEECDLGPYFQEVAIPHKGYYGFHEMVAVRDDPSASDALSINRAYERFFQRLVTLDSAMEPMPGASDTEMSPEVKVSIRPTSGSALLKEVGFDNDIFISYAHNDDISLGDTSEGFVSKLHEALSVRLVQLLGRRVRIWFDRKPQGNDLTYEPSQSALEKTAIFLAVVSPSYLNSSWCVSELNSFAETAQSQGGTWIGNRSRLFWISRSPLPQGSLPEILRPLLGYEFYRVTEAGRLREFRDSSDQDTRSAYYTRVDDLAQDISRLLRAMESGVKDQAEVSGTVYLAETSSDVTTVREELRRELLARGYQVLPDKPLPWTAEDLIRSVHDDLSRAQLSVHFVGSRSGIIPEGETRPMVALQYELAMQQTGLNRVIWAPRDLDVHQQVSMLESSGMEGTEFLRSGVEDLKSFVLDKLAHKPSTLKQVKGKGSVPQIYLVCDIEDLPAAKILRDHLFNMGVEATLPLFDGDPAELRQDRKEMFQTCDGVLVFWGACSEAWIRIAFRELRMLRRSKPIPFALYMAPPLTSAKDLFDTREGFVIRNESVSEVSSLLEEIRSRSSA